jgi:hypothetical protein
VVLASDDVALSCARAITEARPDIEIIDASVLFDVAGAEALAARRPELTALIRASLLGGGLNARCTFFPIWAQLPTVAQVSTIVPWPT